MQVQSVPEFLAQDKKHNLSFIAQHFHSHKDKSVQVNANNDFKFISKVVQKLHDTFSNNADRDAEMIIYNVKMVAHHVFYGYKKHKIRNIIVANKTKQITQFDKKTRDLLLKIRSEALQIQHYMYSFSNFYIDSNTGGEILLSIQKLIHVTYNIKKHKEYLDDLIVNNAINSDGFSSINRCFYIDINNDIFHNAICMLYSIERMFVYSRSRFICNSKEVQVELSPVKLGSSECIDMTEQAVENHHEIWLKRLCLYRRISKKVSISIGSDLFDIVLNFIPRDKVFNKLRMSNNLFNYQLLEAISKLKNTKEDESQLSLYLKNVYDKKYTSKKIANK